MSVLMMVELPGATTELYDKVNEQMGIEDDLPEGLISHNAGPTESGLVIVDVWESREAFEKFASEQAGPVLERMGVPQMQPRILPIHNLIEQGRGRDAGVMMIVEVPGLGPDDYDAMISKMEAHRGDGANHPAVSHAAAVADGGLLVVDVWDSPESWGRFAEQQVGPAAGAGLGSLEPRFVPIHNRFAR